MDDYVFSNWIYLLSKNHFGFTKWFLCYSFSILYMMFCESKNDFNDGSK